MLHIASVMPKSKRKLRAAGSAAMAVHISSHIPSYQNVTTLLAHQKCCCCLPLETCLRMA